MSPVNNSTALIFSKNTTNISEGFDNFSEGGDEYSKSVIYGFLVFLFFGSCVNLLEAIALMRCKKKSGVFSIILQINIADTVLFFIAILEIITSFYKSWTFNTSTCMLYRGTEIFANSLSTYLIICLNFHVVTFWNLHNFQNVKNNKNPLTSFSENSSSECLVTRNEHRSVIDYRKRKNDVAVIFPVIFLWILCLSVSIPNYVLSSTVEIQNKTLCVILQNAYGKTLHSLLLVFSSTVPCFVLAVSLGMLIWKLSQTSQGDIDSVLTKQFREIKGILIFCIVLTVFYMLTSFQRHIFHSVATIKEFFVYENYYYYNVSNVFQIIVHYSGSGLRGILCLIFVPNLRHTVANKLVICCNKDS